MKKKLSALVACLTLVVLASGSAMASFNLTPTTNNGPGHKLIDDGTDSSKADITEILKNDWGILEQAEVYKADVGTPVVESGSAAGLYTTVYDPSSDPKGATITFDGGQTFIDATHLLVKGGGPPSLVKWFLFNISDWDGQAPIVLSGFFPGNIGSISHISIYGSLTAVPEPTSIGLFVLGLGCVTGGSFIRRRRA